MNKTAKIYCAKGELSRFAPTAKLVASYPAFQVVELAPAALKKAAAFTPVEDITKLFQIETGRRRVDTKTPRYSRQGKVQPHPAYKNVKPLTRGGHHYLVQFVGPIKKAWISAVKKAGGVARGPFADFAYIFKLDAKALAAVSSLPPVRWVGHLPPESRVAPGVLAGAQEPKNRKGKGPFDLGGDTGTLTDLLTLQFFDAETFTAGKQALEKTGAGIVSAETKARVIVVKVPTSSKARRQTVKLLSEIHGVRLIAPMVARSTRNNVAVTFMGTQAVIAPLPQGLALDGSGEIIGIADTGLDTGNPATVRADFQGRVASIFSWPIDRSLDDRVTNKGADDGPSDLDSGHGTHVAGSVLGAGSQGPGNAPAIKGLSHGAQLVFQAIEQKMDYVSEEAGAPWKNAPYVLAGIPTDLGLLFQQAYDAGARIHSNSWGGGPFGEYALESRQVDDFVWKNPDFCILIAAGNDGADANPGADGIIDEGSVTPPGTAKNCITVGASESVRGEFATVAYGRFPNGKKRFPKDPIKTDTVSNNPNDMAAFSSRGPTTDGRIKPDVVAPGTAILSTRSTLLAPSKQGWGPYGPNPAYMFDGGTSMATPLTAGAVGVVRQFFRTRQNIAAPTAALLKATLICGAVRMPLPYVPGDVLADNHQGYGRVNLETVLTPQAPAAFGFSEIKPGLQTGQLSEKTVQVAAGAARLRVVLTYTDFPGHVLKNNLNLLVIAPNGTRFVGNARAGSNSLQFDSTNNVEACEIPAPAPGGWRLQVIAANIPQGPQPFALVWLA